MITANADITYEKILSSSSLLVDCLTARQHHAAVNHIFYESQKKLSKQLKIRVTKQKKKKKKKRNQQSKRSIRWKGGRRENKEK